MDCTAGLGREGIRERSSRGSGGTAVNDLPGMFSCLIVGNSHPSCRPYLSCERGAKFVSLCPFCEWECECEQVEERLREAAEEQKKTLEERLAAEKSAREETEEAARHAAANAEGEMTKLREELRQAQQTAEEMRERMEREIANRGCMIL